MRILVSHPHVAAVATGLVGGLAARGMLARYVSGVVAAEGSLEGRLLGRISARRPAVRNRIIAPLGPSALSSLAPVELGARALAKLAQAANLAGPSAYDAMFVLHDAVVAALPWPRGTTAVYAYEDAARFTFARARRRGLARVWDLPLPHYATIERMWRTEAKRWPGAMGESPPVEPAWKKARKDAELAMADVVSVASRFTRESLEELGVTAPILVTPYGFPVEDFTPKRNPPSGPFTVLSVGTHDLRKGTPYLLEAWRKAELKGARLRLVGRMRLRPEFLARWGDLFASGRIEHVPHRAKSELGADYRAADLLVFPTLGDGFGLVMQEAMCCATPVLTTRCGGGPEIVTDGEDGFLVSERDVDALALRLRDAYARRDDLVVMGQRARARAERWGWRDAGLAAADALASKLR